MKTTMRNLLWIVVISFSLNILSGGAMMQRAEAAPATQTDKAKAAKAKEQAKKAKEREKAKAARAKEAEKRAKEREKAAAERQKAAEKAEAQRQKEAQKAEAQRQKEAAQAEKAEKAEKAAPAAVAAKEATKAEPKKAETKKADNKKAAAKKAQAKKAAAKKAQAKKAAAKKSPAKPSQEEVYAQRLKEVTKYNEHVARYMTRDISHRIGVWGQFGYSAIFPSGFSYKAGDKANGINALGFQSAAKGWVGGGAGLGYQLRYRRMLFTTGVEIEIYNSLNSIYDGNKSNPLLERAYDATYPTLGYPMRYEYRFEKMQDMYRAGFVQIPVLFGMEFADKQGYFLAGPKVGLGVIGSSQLSSTIHTRGIDKELIDPLEGMTNHGFDSRKAESPKTKVDFGLNLALAAEIGMSLDKYMQPKVAAGKKPTAGQRFARNLRTRIALFAEYGVLNVQKSSNANTTHEIPADMRALPTMPSDVKLVSSLNTASAKDAKLNPFLVGVKLTFWYELPRKNLKPKALPTEPTPRMMARVTNADTRGALAGAMVAIKDMQSGKIANKTTNSQGYITGRFRKGQYQVRADKMGFFSDSVMYAMEGDLKDTLQIALLPEPKPIVYTYCARVYAGDTGMPVEANVRIDTPSDTTTLYVGMTADDGLFVTELTAGQYFTHLRYAGYMPLDDTTEFVQDTLAFYLTKIKEGIKVKINNLFFATNKTYILPQSEAAMEDLAQFMLDNPTVEIRIVGHTDSIGSDRANQILSEGRANSVRRDLIKRGVDAARIEAIGKGESEPVDTNSTEEGRQNNRRVEFTITATGGEDIEQVF